MISADGWIQILTAFCGTLGFGFLFNSRGKKLLFSALGGMLAWTIFLLLEPIAENEVLRYFLVSVIITVYSECLARQLKAPAGTFCILSLIPLIPGGALYYAASHALSRDVLHFSESALHTLELAAALSLGIVLVTAVMRLIKTVRRLRHEKRR